MTVTKQRKIHQTIFQVVIWVTIISMALSAVLFKVFNKGAGDALATIDGTPIELKEFRRRIQATQRRLAMLQMQFERAGVPYDPSLFEQNPVAHALQSLVDDALVDQVVKSLNLQLDEQYIGHKLTDPYFLSSELPEFIPPYVLASAPEISKQTIERMLAHEHVRISDFEQYVEKSLARHLVKDIVTTALYVPTYAIKQTYIQQYAPKTFDVLTIPFATALAQVKGKELSESEIAKFYEQERKKYVVAEKRSATVYTFDPVQYGISVADADVAHYYEQHKNKYVQSPVKVKVRRIVFAVGSKADAPLVHAQAQTTRAQVMQDPKQGTWHEMDYFARGEKEPEFEQVAFGLKEDGAISPVVQTKTGFEILQRVGRKPATYKPLSSVRAEVEQALRNQQFHKEFGKGLTKQTLEQFAQQKRGAKTTITLVAKQDNPLHAKLFGLRAAGDFAALHHEGKGMVVIVTDIVSSHIPKLGDIKAKVMEDLYRQKARSELRKAVNEAAVKAKESHAPQGRTIANVKGDDTERIKQLTKEGLPVVQMLEMGRAGEVLTAVEGDGYVIRLTSIAPTTDEQIAAKKQEITASLTRNWSHLLYQRFVASLARSATISVNEMALSQV